MAKKDYTKKTTDVKPKTWAALKEVAETNDIKVKVAHDTAIREYVEKLRNSK